MKAILERFSDLAVIEFGGFRAWPFLSLAVAKIDLFSGFCISWVEHISRAGVLRSDR